MTRRLTSAIAVLITFTRTAAAGDESTRPLVSLEVRDCPNVEIAEARSLLSIELRQAVVEMASTEAPTRATISCAGDYATIAIDDAVTAKMISRRVRLGGARGRARLLAIATSELLFASWLELDADLSRARAEPPPLAAEQASARVVMAQRFEKASTSAPRSRAKTKRMRHTIVGVFSVRQFLPFPSPSIGGGARYLQSMSGRLMWSAEVTAENGSLRRAEGTVRSFAFTGMGGLHYRPIETEGWHARVGAGVRVGYASLAGDSSAADLWAGRTLEAPWIGAAFLPGMGWKLGHLVIDLSMELGVNANMLEGRVGPETVRFGGGYAAMLMGAGAAF